MATISRKGYGQVEPNHLSGIKTGQIYAQLPLKSTIAQIENGQFAKYDAANGEVNTAAAANGEYMLCLNEVKTYKLGESYKDYVMKAADFFDGKAYPRMIKTNVGDLMTLNTLEGANSGADATFTGTDAITVGAKLTVNATGFLTVTASPAAGAMVWQVVAITTMPDTTQAAVKVQRIQ